MKRFQKYNTSILFLLYITTGTCFAQEHTHHKLDRIDYPHYLQQVGQNNLEYIAEKYTLDIAEAAILVSKIFPDPELALAGANNTQRLGLGYDFGAQLNWTLELGGKRKARVRVAKSEAEITKLLLDDFFRNLRADATLAYIDAIHQKNILDVHADSYQTMKKLAASDSIRLKLGTIMEIDMRQSKLEAGMLRNEVYQSEGSWKAALTNLSIQIGGFQKDTLYYPNGNFTKFERDFNLSWLIDHALEHRADLQAALKNKNLSLHILELAKANRSIDIGLSVGVGGTTVQHNIVAPTPSFVGVGGGISIPLKFSNNLKGELKQAQFGVEQAEVLYKQATLQIETEVSQAYHNYIAMKKQVQQFNLGLLEEAKKVFEGKVYSYQRGSTSLLEVLNAKRTYNEVHQAYHTAYHDLGAALIELERTVGIWDIEI